MPDPDRLIKTLQQAISAFRSTPGRRGRLVVLQDTDEVLAAGDLHGNIANFRRLLEVAQLARFPRRHLVLQEVVHSPFRYPGGGDKSHQLIDLLAALKVQFPKRIHFLLGNHELAQWSCQRIAKGEEELNGVFYMGVEAAYGLAAPKVYAAYCELFAAVPLAVRTPNRVLLSHSLPNANRLAGFEPAVLERDQHDEAELRSGGPVHALVWGRDTSLPNAEAFLQKMDADLLITGHIPCDEGFETPNNRQLILDCLGDPACYCLFPTDRPLTHEDLLKCVKRL
jgi:hypothetical protein